MTRHAVLIVGAGPTGLMLAAELALARVDVAIVERRATQDLSGSRAGGLGLHARTIEVLDQRGVADRFVSQGQTYPAVSFNKVRLDLGDFPTRRNYLLGLVQKHTERILAQWVGELGVPIRRECEVVDFTQDDAGVDVALADGTSLRADYLVGCDGGRSVVRKTAGIEFPGWDATTSWLMAEASTTAEPPFGFRETVTGSHAIGRGENGAVRVVLKEAQVRHGGEPTLGDVSETLVAVYGSDFGIHSPTWISRFDDNTRQAAAYRDRRVLLAGDAAHVHPPLGGQGLNIGVQDAVNLGWKLAQVIRRISPEGLLDSYFAERHPVAARVLRTTMAQVALGRSDERTKAVGEVLAGLLAADGARKRMAGELSGLDIRYDFGEGHPLLGRRMPDLDLVSADGPVRAFTLLHAARPLLLNFGARGAIDIGAWADRVRSIDAQHDGAWELPVIGAVAAPSAVLIRPDGHVAWVGEGTHAGLAEALARWCGSPD